MPVRLLSLRSRLGARDGFTMLVALGIMLIVLLISAAVFAAVGAGAYSSRDNLDGKQAYSAAQAGLQAYVGQLNQNAASSAWWQTCANDTATNVAVPGSTGVTYSYQPVISGCATSGAVGTVVDQTAGLLRMEFTGHAGSDNASRTIVADFQPDTPLAFLWYTVHETANPSLSGDSNCPSNATTFYWNSTVPSNCQITWTTGDQVNGPMYTQDQFLTSGTPTFGRANSTDPIETPASAVCVGGSATQECPSGVIQGKADPGAQSIALPTDNSNLAANALTSGITLPAGTTTLTLSVAGTQTNATAVTCTTAVSQACITKTYTNLAQTPVIYAPNVSGGTCSSTAQGANNSTYNPTSVSYYTVSGGSSWYGACGDLYVHGTYNTSLTLAAQNDAVVTGSILNSTDANGTTAPTGNATLGIVATSWVRVLHSCSSTTPNVTIDAAILALTNSFYVDNYNCGGVGTLTVHGSIAQAYRGAVATGNAGGGVVTGYVKNYNYDSRLKVSIPPYLFNLQNTSWSVVRETLCASGQPSSSTQSCAYTGNAG